MNNVIKHLSSIKKSTSTSIGLVKIATKFSPIILTTLQLALILTVMVITLPALAIDAHNEMKQQLMRRQVAQLMPMAPIKSRVTLVVKWHN